MSQSDHSRQRLDRADRESIKAQNQQRKTTDRRILNAIRRDHDSADAALWTLHRADVLTRASF